VVTAKNKIVFSAFKRSPEDLIANFWRYVESAQIAASSGGRLVKRARSSVASTRVGSLLK
jgi:hypothetical protein